MDTVVDGLLSKSCADAGLALAPKEPSTRVLRYQHLTYYRQKTAEITLLNARVPRKYKF